MLPIVIFGVAKGDPFVVHVIAGEGGNPTRKVFCRVGHDCPHFGALHQITIVVGVVGPAPHYLSVVPTAKQVSNLMSKD